MSRKPIDPEVANTIGAGTISSGMVMQLYTEGERAIAELSRICGLLEDQQKLATTIRDTIKELIKSNWLGPIECSLIAARVADKLKAYLLGEEE